MVGAEEDLAVEVELEAGDEVVVTNELVEDVVAGPVPAPNPDNVVEAALNKFVTKLNMGDAGGLSGRTLGLGLYYWPQGQNLALPELKGADLDALAGRSGSALD